MTANRLRLVPDPRGRSGSRNSVTNVMRNLAVGAEVQQPGGVHFRTWAPASKAVRVRVGKELGLGKGAVEMELRPEGTGYFSGVVEEARAGDFYRYVLDAGSFPDPASRFQPAGPHEASQVIDPRAYAWNDDGWPGVGDGPHVIYEMHIGTFTQAGTWAAAAELLPGLAELGITILEIMPIADFPGRFGWGYDGVNLFAHPFIRIAGRRPRVCGSSACPGFDGDPRCGL
jgi:maltooligosyltrehalose trehalohydrolase